MTKESARAVALDCLLAVTEDGAFSHTVLNSAREKYAWMSVEDRSFITRLVHGTLEYLIQLDAVLNRISSVPVRKMKPPVRGILRMSAYQLLYLDRIPERAVVHEAVELAAMRGFRGLKGFVNAVLRSLCREKEAVKREISESRDFSFRYAMPPWIVRQFREELGEERAELVLQSFFRQMPLYVRPVSGRAGLSDKGSEELPEEHPENGPEEFPKELVPSPWCPDLLVLPEGDDTSREAREQVLALLREGRAIVQDLGSAAAVRAAMPTPGSRIIDLCAAPGGKSIAAASLMEGSGQVLAFDLTEEKVQILNQNAERAGLAGIIRGETGDATVFRQELEGSADLVIADLPCSGLGVLGQKPDIRLNLKEEQIPELAALQRTMLGQAARYVRPGGKLLFSTCTISRRENEDNRAWFLETHPEFRPEPVETGESLFPGLSGRPELSEGYLQMLPGEFPCDGFFFALFRRTE